MLLGIITTIASYCDKTILFGLETLGSGMISYNDAVVQGVFQQKAVIQYDTMVYESHEVYAKELDVISRFGVKKQTSNPVRGFDKTMPKGVFTLQAAFNSQGTAGVNVNIKLAAKDKDNLIERQKLLFSFEPTVTTHTNEAIVIAKYPACEDGSGGLGALTGDYYITIRAANPTLKIGTSGTTAIPADTTFLKATATMNPDSSEAVAPVSWHETPIENFYTFIRNPYEYNDNASRMNLYTKGNLRYNLDSDARKVYLAMKLNEFLYGGSVYYNPVTDSATASSAQVSKMRGFFKWLKEAASPAIVGYDSATKSFATAHEEFVWALADPKIHENKRMVICDQAYQKYWTDQKTSKPGIELAPNTAYGIPGITDVYTGIGNLVLELFVNDQVSEWQRLQFQNDYTKPFACALVPYNVQMFNFLPDTLYTELQNPSSTDHLAEYRGAFTFHVHNAGTGRFGMCYPTA